MISYNELEVILRNVFSNEDLVAEAVKGNFDIIKMFVPEDGEESKEMQEFISKFFVSNIGGKTVVISRDDMNRKYDFSNFKHLYANIKEKHKVVDKARTTDDAVAYKIIEKPCVDRFLNDVAERFDEVVFKPSGNIRDGQYNFFKGFAYEGEDNGRAKLYLSHIRENICSGDDNLYNYILDWMAHIIQFPEKKVDKCIVLRGSQGTGKGVFVSQFASLLGDASHTLTSMEPLLRGFNSELANNLLVFADEVTWGGKKAEGSKLKTFISENRINIEFKGKDVVPMNNFARLIIASNHDWVVPVEGGDRRYVVIDVADKMKENNTYFNKIMNDMRNGGREDLMHLLVNRNLSGRDWSIKPVTHAIDDQKMLSLEPHENWLYDCIVDSIDKAMIPWAMGYNTKVENRDVYDMYKKYMGEHHRNAYLKSSRELSGFLTKVTGLKTTKSNSKTYRTFSKLIKNEFESYAGVGNKIWE